MLLLCRLFRVFKRGFWVFLQCLPFDRSVRCELLGFSVNLLVGCLLVVFWVGGPWFRVCFVFLWWASYFVGLFAFRRGLFWMLLFNWFDSAMVLCIRLLCLWVFGCGFRFGCFLWFLYGGFCIWVFCVAGGCFASGLFCLDLY